MSENPSKPPLLAPTEPKHFRSSSSAALSRLRGHAQARAQGQAQPQAQAWTTSSFGHRHSSNPLIRSPLQQSFPAYPNPTAAGEAEAEEEEGQEPNRNRAMMQETPSRRSRRNEQGPRKRGESRSSSVPIIVRTPEGEEEEDYYSPSNNSDQQLSSRSRPLPPQFRANSPFQSKANPKPKPNPLNNPNSNPNASANANRRSVKHLTCFWWWEKGECRFSEEECLYAHHDTGNYTLAPRQVIPGEPAKAGKSLERALNKLAIANRSSASLSSLGNTHHVHAHAHTPHNSSASATNLTSLSIAGSGSGSGVETQTQAQTFHDVDHSNASSPSPLEIGQVHAQQLKTDNDFLRGLVTESQREKRALVDTIESLQNEKSQLQARIESMSSERSDLLFEREVLQRTIKKLQYANPGATGHGTGIPLPLRSPTTGAFGSSLAQQSPWGAIGSRRPSPISIPVESMQQQQQQGHRAVSDGAADLGTNKSNNTNNNNNNNNNRSSTSSSGFRGNNGTPLTPLNPTAQPYEDTDTDINPDVQLGGDFSPFGKGAEGDKLRSVLRHLGPSF